MSDHGFTHVIFSDGSSVALGTAQEYQTAHPTERVIKAHPGDTRYWSWAKSWYSPDDSRIVRIGAGAYGDLTIWTEGK